MVNTFRLRRAVGMALSVMMLVVTLGAGVIPAAAQQEPTATPGLDLNLDQNATTAQNQQTDQSTTVTPTPVVGSASGPAQANPTPAQQQTQAAAQQSQPTTQQTQPTAQQPTGAPVLAQGLIYLDGGDVIWQVREVQLSGNDTSTGNARILMQRSGESIIRNDVTGKRTKLETGEAYFAAAGDPYTTFASGGSSTVWVFEISNSNQVGDGAFYLSPNVTGYGESVYDFELTEYVVAAGETEDFPGGDGPSLLVVLSGGVTVTAGEGPAELAEKDGLVVDGSATVAGPESGEATYVTLTVGPKVSDESAAPPEPATASDTTSDTTAGQTQAGSTGDTTTDTTTQAAEEPATSAAPAEQNADTGEFVTSVQVGAKEDIGVTMYADGVLVFDGWLGAGEWTDFYTGTNFEVYTTSGENTLFKNSCGGDSFLMGYETGDAHYFLAAGPQSCAPVG